MERRELKEILTRTLKELTEKEQKVIFLYYFEELTLKEISAVLEVTESRISQLHTRALQKMRTKLGVPICCCTRAVNKTNWFFGRLMNICV